MAFEDGNRKGREEIGDWLASSAGNVVVTVFVVLLGIGMAIKMILDLSGWVQWAAIAAVVVALVGAAWWFFLAPRKD